MLINYFQSSFNLKKDPSVLDPTCLSNLNKNIPRMIFTHGSKNLIKSIPSELIKPKKEFKKKKIILLVRDPQDVVVSSYFQEFKRDSNDQQVSLNKFIFRERGGTDTIIKYYKNWYNIKDEVDELLLIKYEDLKIDTKNQMKRILHFIGLDKIDLKKLDESINFSSFENMKRMEKEGVFNSNILKPMNKNDVDSYKTRKGKVEGFVDYLDSNEINELNEKMKKMPSWYGYKKI